MGSVDFDEFLHFYAENWALWLVNNCAFVGWIYRRGDQREDQLHGRLENKIVWRVFGIHSNGNVQKAILVAFNDLSRILIPAKKGHIGSEMWQGKSKACAQISIPQKKFKIPAKKNVFVCVFSRSTITWGFFLRNETHTFFFGVRLFFNEVTFGFVLTFSEDW